MYRGIIGLVQGDPQGVVESARGTTAVEAEAIETFGSDGQLVSGKAVGTVERERERPVVRDDMITTREEPDIEEVYAEFLADLNDGWVTIDTSDGEFIWNHLSAEHRVKIERAVVDVHALAREARDWDRIEVWQSQTSWGDLENHERPGGVTIGYHDDADWSDGNHIGQLGFDGRWDGVNVRGTVTKSGYLALFNRGEETAAAFLNSVVLPHCSVPVDEDEQFLQEVDE